MASGRAQIRKLMNWVMPRNVEGLAGIAFDALVHKRLKRNAALSGRHAGGRCFVIGNGPSLKRTDLSPLAGEWTIGANSFYKHPQAAQVGLKYLCIGDPHFMADTAANVTWHQTLAEKMPGTVFLLHDDAVGLIERNHLYPGREVYFVRTGLTTHTTTFARIDFTRSLNVGMTTGTLVAIPLAMYLGFDEIYLVGFDANWLDNFDGSYHFYDKHELFPEFDSVSADTRGFSYEDEVTMVLAEYQSHRLLQELARRRGVQLANATLGGRLDMHPRVEYASLFGGRR
jgi:hypothetical protein